MVDTVNGKVRVRSWPRPRGQAKTKRQDESQRKFAAIQLASKFMSPQQMLDIMQAREGTPILPRDIVTSMLSNRLLRIILDDGRKLYPMPARIDVSDALDALGQTPGSQLIRGPELWEATVPSQTDLAGCILTRTDSYVGTASNVTYELPWQNAPIQQGPFWDAGDPAAIIAPWPGWYALSFLVRAEGVTGPVREFDWTQNGEIIAAMTRRDGNQGSANHSQVSALTWADTGDRFAATVRADATNRAYTNCRAVMLYL